MWPGFKSRRRRHVWVEFVVGSLPCHDGFSPGTPVFPSPQKLAFPNSNLTRNQVDKEALCGCATFKSLFIYLLRGYLIIFVFVDEFPVGNVCNFFLMASISVRFEEYPSKGLVKRYIRDTILTLSVYYKGNEKVKSYTRPTIPSLNF